MNKNSFKPQYLELIRKAEADELPAGFQIKSKDGDIVKFDCVFADLPLLASLMGFGTVEYLTDHLDGLNSFTGTIASVDGPPDLDAINRKLGLSD